MALPTFNSRQDYLRDELYLGGYETQAKWSQEFEKTYEEVGKLIGGESEEIAFVESATMAWYKAFQSIPFLKGDKILTCESEYGSNFMGFIQAKEKKGIIIEVIPSNDNGEIDVEALEGMIDDRVKLIAITHMPTNSGLVNPAERVGQIAENRNILYLLDACQSAGQYPLDVKALKCDFLSATGRKYLRAPRGTGFLYVKKSRWTELGMVFPDLLSAEWVASRHFTPRKTARRFENFESNKAGIIGLGKAANYINEHGIERMWERIQGLAEHLREELSQLPALQIRDQGETRSGICTFTMDGHSPDRIKRELRNRHINVSVSGKESTFIDMEKRGLEAVVRASVHYFNTEEEIQKLKMALENIALLP